MSLSMVALNMKEQGKHTIDDCAMYCGDWNGLQRHRHGVHVWPDGAQEEDQWEYVIAPRSCSTCFPMCLCLFARVELPANDPQE